ncbi:MAG TPA: hypothetical protein VLH85_01625 [Levilinea sp.]|nr:hypothetical protein [Levilinea sp.]
MKRVVIPHIFLVLLMTLGLAGSAPVEAQTTSTWISVIAYFNPNPGPLSSPEELSVVLYRHDGIQIDLDFGNANGAIPILPYQSGTLLLGQLNNDPSFQGSAIVSATVPIMAVYKRAASDNEAYSPILYTSFDINQAGQGVIYLPSVRRLPAYDTQVGIQNVESLPIDLEITIYDAAGAAVHTVTSENLTPLTSFIFKMSSYAGQIPVPFEGSMVVRARLAGSTAAARIVAAAQEMQIGGRRAFAYEGLSTSDYFIFMPTATCLAGETAQTTTFTVQNTGVSPSNIYIDYYDESGELIATSSVASVPAYASASFNSCSEDVLAATQGKDMSAVVISEGHRIAVVGRLESSDGLMTAFTGQPMGGLASGGAYRVVLPYVEWSTRPNGFRTTISVMNVSGDPAVNVKAYYYANRGSSPVAVHHLGSVSDPLLNYTRRTTSPVAARAVEGRGFNGAVILESDQPIVALARVVRAVDISGYKTLGEDYNGIPFNP